MTEFVKAKDLRDYIRSQCREYCADCRWCHREGDCMLMWDILKIDYRWIPTSDRLPDRAESEKLLLLAVRRGNTSDVRTGAYHSINGEWVVYGYGLKLTSKDVIAWQIAPEPYGGNDEH